MVTTTSPCPLAAFGFRRIGVILFGGVRCIIIYFEFLAESLDREFRAEEDRGRNHDPSHFAYPTFATAAIQRRDILKRSADKLKIQADAAKKALSEAIEEFEAVALLDDGDRIRDQSQIIARGQDGQVLLGKNGLKANMA